MNNKLKPALLGGLIVGVLSGVLSLIPFVNYCCCIWSIGGGALAAYLYIKSSPIPVGMGDGAMVGALAGVVGGILYLIINLPITLLIGVAAVGDQLTRAGVNVPVSPFILVIIGSIITAVILVVLATLGGVIGTAIFEKRKGDGGAPPPAQNYGGTPGTFGAGA
jgi:hypothetical protein